MYVACTYDFRPDHIAPMGAPVRSRQQMCSEGRKRPPKCYAVSVPSTPSYAAAFPCACSRRLVDRAACLLGPGHSILIFSVVIVNRNLKPTKGKNHAVYEGPNDNFGPQRNPISRKLGGPGTAGPRLALSCPSHIVSDCVLHRPAGRLCIRTQRSNGQNISLGSAAASLAYVR